MFQDKLDPGIFTSVDGKNYRTPGEIDLKELSAFFHSRNYKIINVNQDFRHISAKVEKNKKLYFIKVGTSSDISTRTENEAVWNYNLSKILTQKGFHKVQIPQVHEHGNFNNLFYLVTDYYENNFIASKYPPDKKNIENYLDSIVDFCIHLIQVNADNPFLLPRDKNELGAINTNLDYYNFVYNQDSKLISHLPECKLEDILEIENEFKSTYSPSLNHGDMVPWHFIIYLNNLIFIDGEQGSFKLPKYFDIVYFYNRIYTRLNSPDIAKEFLNKFILRSRINKDEIIDSINPLMACRLIDSFWHYKNENIENGILFNLKKELVNKTLHIKP